MAYRIGAFRLDPDARLLERAGEALEVPRRVFDCLAYLVEQHARAVGRDELIERVWKRRNVSDNQLAQTVLAVRRLLDDDGAQQKLIRTVPGFGYHFVGAVEPDTGLSAAPAGVETGASAALGEVAAVNEAVAPPAEKSAAFASDAALVRQRRSRVLLNLGVLVLLLIAAAGALEHWWPVPPATPAVATQAAPPPAPALDWVWVLPARIEVTGSDWARVGIATLVAERLRHNGAVVVPMQNVLTRLPVAYSPDQLDGLRKELAASQVVAPAISREGEQWRVELRADGEDGPQTISMLDKDLLQAARLAADRLKTAPTDAPEASNEGMEMIAQLIRSRDFEAAIRQIARLPEEAQERPDVGLLRIGMEIEQGRYAQARVLATSLRAGLEESRFPAVAGRLGLIEAQLRRHAGEPDWGRSLDPSLDLLRSHGTPRDYGAALIQKGDTYGDAGDFAAASRLYTQARRQYLIAADEVGAARTSQKLAQLAAMQDRPSEALPHLQDSLVVYRRYDSVAHQFNTLRWMVFLQFGMLRWADVETTLSAMRQLLPRGTDADERAYLQARTLLLLATGRSREAASLLEDAEGLQGEEHADQRRTVDLFRMQLDLELERYAEIDAGGRASFTRVSGTDGVDTVARRDHRETVLYLWLEARRRLAEDRGPLPTLLDPPAELSSPTRYIGLIAKGHWLRERGQAGLAEQAYRDSLRLANKETRVASLMTSDALIGLLLHQARSGEAAQVLDDLLAADPTLPERDFNAAMLTARVCRAEGDTAGWRSAVADATRLAGERRLPAELVPGSP